MKRLLVFAVAGIVLATPAAGQVEATLRGVVRSAATGKPIQHAQVQLIGTNVATLTDDAGRYGLMSVPVGVSVIRITHRDHVSVAERVEVDRPRLLLRDFEMIGPEFVLSEVVAKAMGSPVEVPGNTTAPRDYKGDQGLSEILNEVSGVTLVRTGGAVGMGVYLYVRGAKSISFSQLPLIIVDGIRIDGWDSRGGAGALELLSPSMIGSVRVLRGASALAQYGPGAADGVILIDTKRGGSGW